MTVYHSPASLLSVVSILCAPVYLLSLKKIYILSTHEMNTFIKWTQVYTCRIPWSVYAFMTKGPGPDDYSKGWEVGEVRESVSESNRGWLVTILFVLKALRLVPCVRLCEGFGGPSVFSLTRIATPFRVLGLLLLWSHSITTLICASIFVLSLRDPHDSPWHRWLVLTDLDRIAIRWVNIWTTVKGCILIF